MRLKAVLFFFYTINVFEMLVLGGLHSEKAHGGSRSDIKGKISKRLRRASTCYR